MKRRRDTGSGVTKRPKKKAKTRKGYSSVARTRGAAVIGEMKYIDISANVTAIPASANWAGTNMDNTTTLCLHGIPAVGAALNQRIGKKIKVLKLKIHGAVLTPGLAASGAPLDACLIRLIIFQDMQTNATQATGPQLMTNLGLASFNPLSFQNTDNFGRFRVLKDKFITLQDPNFGFDVAAGTNRIDQGLIKYFKCNLKFKKPIEIQFNSTNGGTVADIVNNSFHIVATCNNDELGPNLYWTCRMCYKE